MILNRGLSLLEHVPYNLALHEKLFHMIIFRPGETYIHTNRNVYTNKFFDIQEKGENQANT